MMPVSYTNRKGVNYTLYKGQTKTGKPRYYFGRPDKGQGEPVKELPPGFTISESVNGVVSLVKDHPSLIQPEDIKVVETTIKQHPLGHQYRISVKHDWIEIYEQTGPDIESLLSNLGIAERASSNQISQMQSRSERYAQYEPVLRFILLDPIHRQFGAKRMYYSSSIGGWLDLTQTGLLSELARTLIPTLGTDQFFELM